MAFSNIDTLNLGNLLQIVFSDGVRNQISNDYRDWEMIKRARVGSTAARELRFMFQTNYGPSAIQYRNPGTSGRDFPSSSQSSISENTAKFKELNATIELEYQLWDRARKSPEKYAEPLALEIMSKTTASKRRLSADLYGDGTGAVGRSSGAPSITSGRILVTLNTANAFSGHIGFFEFGDKLNHYTNLGAAGTAPTVSSGTFSYWQVETKDRENDQVVLSARSSAGTELTVTVVGVADGDFFYRSGQPTIPNRTTISDYGTSTEVIAGLESLAAADGRTIHGILMSGANAGTRQDANGDPLDVRHIQRALDNVKVNVGADAYKWKMMCMAPEAHSTLIESRETDRRFQTVDDNKRGIKYFAYVHGNDQVETYTSEYCPKKRIYIKPENKSNSQKVLEYWGSDFEPVRMNGMGEFHLKPSSSGGYVNNVISFLSGIGVLICKHPASIATIENFDLS